MAVEVGGEVHVACTGSRWGMTAAQKITARYLLVDLRGCYTIQGVHLGDCVGADVEWYLLATRLGLWRVGHPPNEDAMRAFLRYDSEFAPLPYLARDVAMVAAAGILLATPHEYVERRRSGTWATWRYAKAAHLKIYRINPDGTILSP